MLHIPGEQAYSLSSQLPPLASWRASKTRSNGTGLRIGHLPLIFSPPQRLLVVLPEGLFSPTTLETKGFFISDPTGPAFLPMRERDEPLSHAMAPLCSAHTV
ncbi:hypothetical protein NXF25_005790 [Crotalus adamanteus]|uniref:Uncharacterized protein n=1 Tax=Crotalus adamanteus TaxID=8729 RepID=A0AAW1BYR7_CROAD